MILILPLFKQADQSCLKHLYTKYSTLSSLKSHYGKFYLKSTLVIKMLLCDKDCPWKILKEWAKHYDRLLRQTTGNAIKMLNNSKNATNSWEVCKKCYWHTFPSDHTDDCAYQRSYACLVRSRTDLVSPPSSMTQPSTSNLSSWGPLFIMSQKALTKGPVALL